MSIGMRWPIAPKLTPAGRPANGYLLPHAGRRHDADEVRLRKVTPVRFGNRNIFGRGTAGVSREPCARHQSDRRPVRGFDLPAEMGAPRALARGVTGRTGAFMRLLGVLFIVPVQVDSEVGMETSDCSHGVIRQSETLVPACEVNRHPQLNVIA